MNLGIDLIVSLFLVLIVVYLLLKGHFTAASWRYRLDRRKQLRQSKRDLDQAIIDLEFKYLGEDNLPDLDEEIKRMRMSYRLERHRERVEFQSLMRRIRKIG